MIDIPQVAGLYYQNDYGDYVIKIAVTGRVICRIPGDAPQAEMFASLFTSTPELIKTLAEYADSDNWEPEGFRPYTPGEPENRADRDYGLAERALRKAKLTGEEKNA